MSNLGEKLTTPIKYAHTAEVTGNGEFPFDMLRYDACWAVDQTDAGRMSMHSRSLRTVRVRSYSPSSVSTFTPARWESFGWTFLAISQWAPRDD